VFHGLRFEQDRARRPELVAKLAALVDRIDAATKPKWTGRGSGDHARYMNGIDQAVAHDGFTLAPSSLDKEGVVEVHFAEKPDEDARAELKAAGFRWAFRNRCWYGPEDQLPDRYQGKGDA
jgi:hypothetical protein